MRATTAALIHVAGILFIPALVLLILLIIGGGIGILLAAIT